jgi:hypothetical protein
MVRVKTLHFVFLVIVVSRGLKVPHSQFFLLPLTPSYHTTVLLSLGKSSLQSTQDLLKSFVGTTGNYVLGPTLRYDVVSCLRMHASLVSSASVPFPFRAAKTRLRQDYAKTRLFRGLPSFYVPTKLTLLYDNSRSEVSPRKDS